MRLVHFFKKFNFELFLEKSNFRLKTKIIFITKGEAVTRHYILRMVEKGLGYPEKKVYFYDDIEGSLWKFLSYVSCPLRVLFWGENSLSDDEVHDFLEGVFHLDGRIILIDPSGQLERVKKEREKSRSIYRRVINCDFPAVFDLQKRTYFHWLESMEQLSPSSQFLQYVIDHPLIESFNLINTLKYAEKQKFSLVDAKKYGLLWSDKEKLMVSLLMHKSRAAFMREGWLDLNSSRFFWLLFWEIHSLLKIKTLFTGFASSQAEKVGLSQEIYYAKKDQARQQSLKGLYRKLFLVMNLMEWRDYSHSVSLLLLYW